MADDLAEQLSSWDGRRAVGSEIAALLRKHDWEATERLLSERLTGYPGPIATACRGIAGDQVTLDGWEEVDADLVDLCRRGRGVTAIGLDLSNYSDADGPTWWDQEPIVEFAAFTDEVFPFSESRRQDLLDLSETFPAPWIGQPLGEETAHLTVTGLRALNGALLHRSSVEPWRPKASGRLADESVAEYLGWWWLHLRFHQAVARDLEKRGLALAVPVLVGTHDVGPWLQTVHVVDRVSDHEAATERILAERAQHAHVWRAAQADEVVGDLRELRAKVRSYGFFTRGPERKQAEAAAAAKVAVAFASAGLLEPSRPIGQMGDKEFERLLEMLRATMAAPRA